MNATVITLEAFLTNDSLQARSEPNSGASPFAFLVVVFVWYFLKSSFDSIGAGISMASVEGVAVGPTMLENFLKISPVLVYLFAWVVYTLALTLNLNRTPIRQATAMVFNFHLAWIAGCTLIFVLSGTSIPNFNDHEIGQIVFAIGDWLSPILLAILFGAWSWFDARTAVDRSLPDDPPIA